MIEAVIFDMDGLLVDSETIWRAAHRTVLEEHGVKVTEEEAREMAGKGTIDIVKLWRERFNGWGPEDDETVCQEIFDEVAKNVDTSAT